MKVYFCSLEVEEKLTKGRLKFDEKGMVLIFLYKYPRGEGNFVANISRFTPCKKTKKRPLRQRIESAWNELKK